MSITKKNSSRYLKHKNNKNNKYNKYESHKTHKQTKYENKTHKTLKHKAKRNVNKKTQQQLNGGSLIFHKDVEISYKKTDFLSVGSVYASKTSPPTISISQLYKDPSIYIKGRGIYYILISVGGRDLSLYKYINNLFVFNKTINVSPINTSILETYKNTKYAYNTSVNCQLYRVSDDKNYTLAQIKQLGTNPINYKGNYMFNLIGKNKK